MAPSDWSQWEKYVVEQLKSHEEDHDEIQKALVQIRIDIAMLKVKSGIWGAIGASIPIIGMVLFEFLMKK